MVNSKATGLFKMDFKNLKTKNLEKGTLLLSPGQKCNYGYRVVSGCLKSFVLDSSGKDHILQFAPEGWFISDLESFTKQTPSKIFIDAIENSEVQMIGKEAVPSFEELDHQLQVELGLKFRNNLIASNNRLISLLSGTAEEKYLEFTQTYPALVQRLPQKLIASYLGMTPEHLSYTRGKLAKKK